MDPTNTLPAKRASTVTPAELARTLQLFQWGLQEIQKMSQRIDGVEKNMRQMARDGVHRDNWQYLERQVTSLREDFHRLEAFWQNDPSSPRRSGEEIGDGNAKSLG